MVLWDSIPWCWNLNDQGLEPASARGVLVLLVAGLVRMYVEERRKVNDDADLHPDRIRSIKLDN